MPYGGMIEFPNAEPEEMGSSTELPPVWSEPKAPDTTVPVATPVPPSMLALLLWGKGDPPASITGKWPCPVKFVLECDFGVVQIFGVVGCLEVSEVVGCSDGLWLQL